MVEDLAYPIQVVGVDTVRSEDGLALSSRNGYLKSKQLQAAASLQQELKSLATQLAKNQSVRSKRQIAELERAAKQNLKKVGFKPQYISVCQKYDLQPAKKGDTDLVILAAALLGETRLIDNLEVTLGASA